MKERIKTIRKAAGKSQTEFGRSVGVSLSSVQKWESGENKPAASVIRLICSTYNVDEIWLRTGKGEPRHYSSRKDEITSFMSELIGGQGTEFQQRLIAVLARLTVDEWDLIERKARELLEEDTKKDPAK